MHSLNNQAPHKTPCSADGCYRRLSTCEPPTPVLPVTLKAVLRHLFFALAVPVSFAQLEGNDNFDDNRRDEARWGTTDTLFGSGSLSETNQCLHYIISGAPPGGEGDYATRQWHMNFGRFIDNWEMQLDVSLPTLTLDDDNDEVEIGLGVGNAADPGDQGSITLNTYRNGTVARQFWSDIRVDNSASLSDAVASTTSTGAALRIRWTAGTRILSFEYDANGAAGGYTWNLLAARIIGEGGYDWGMTDTSLFGVAVFGASYSQNLTLASSVYADNFSAHSEVLSPPPRLNIVPSGSGEATITWSPATPGFVLQETDSLSAAAWTNSPSGATNPVVTPVSSSPRKFYRLFKP